MRNKFFILLFGLLLAVGWTSNAQAQAMPRQKATSNATFMSNTSFIKEAMGRPSAKGETFHVMNQGRQFRAPLRSQNFNVTARTTYPKSWYQALPDVTWNGGSQNITEPFTTADGMMALVERVYTDKTIPGTKYSEFFQCDLPYQTIEFGWDIVGTNYIDDIKIQAHPYVALYEIDFYDANENPLGYWSAYESGTSFPSSWTTTGGVGNNDGAPYLNPVDGYMGVLTIPASYLQSLNNTTGYVNVRVFAYNYAGSSYVSNAPLYVYSDTYPYHATRYYPEYSTQYVYRHDHFHPGTITPPDSCGYSVILVKLKDEFSTANLKDSTTSRAELKQFFSTYFKEMQLLTDGLRVQEGTADAGTLFAYTGDLNKFYFIGKGKSFYLQSLDSTFNDRAPFYSMYEEFSPYVSGGSEDHSDLYEKMRQGKTYPVVHDCEGVIHMQHWFTVSSEDGSTENRVNALVFYVPDNRGHADSIQNYNTYHQPTVGMYMIDLYADIEASSTPDYYTTTVTWEDNLDVITHSDGIPQTYYLYEIWDKDGDGDLDTTLVYTGPETVWHGDYPVGDPNAYDVSYYVIGVPTAATNPDTFFAKSNTDDVTVPGKTDFIGLQWARYESDYVTKNDYDPSNNEVNYYRNWLSPHKLSSSNQAGISAGNVGSTGRTLTLYRENEPIIDLELVMNGNKAYYRIKYINRSTNQQVEHGYNENTGEKENN